MAVTGVASVVNWVGPRGACGGTYVGNEDKTLLDVVGLVSSGRGTDQPNLMAQDGHEDPPRRGGANR